MEKLSQYFKKFIEKIKSLSMIRKIAYGTIISGVILSLILFFTYSNANKYGILFSNLSVADGKTISDQLAAKKVTDVKIQGSTIYVPKGQVDALRLELAPSLTDNSAGYELFDTSSQFGMTDDQFQITKLRATQGELEKTIKSMPQIENARVHIAETQDSAFVTTQEPGKVAVYLTLKPGMKLDVSQVKAIIALISGSLDNVPPKNVDIIDQDLDLLSANVFDSDTDNSAVPVDTQQAMVTKFEGKLEDSVKSLLEPALGSDKVKVKVNVDMNFDSTEKTVISYDPNKVIVSAHNVANGNLGVISGSTQSPVDNNMSNYSITTQGAVNPGVTSLDSTVNYDVGQTELKTLNAPGQITRITASVMYDGNLDSATKAQIQAAVAGAIGFNPARNDSISVVGINFDPAKKAADLAAIAALKAQTAQEARARLFKNIAIIAGIAITLIALLVVFLVSRLKKRKMEPKSIDVTVGDALYDKDAIPYVPIDLDVENENSHIEKDIKKYAEEKPDQVAEIIKSWLAEDER